MKSKIGIKHIIILQLVVLFVLSAALVVRKVDSAASYTVSSSSSSTEKKFIKWMEFNVCYKALDKAYTYDVKSQTQDVKLNWIELLAYLGTKYGGDFSKYKDKDMNALVKKLQSKNETINSLTKKMKHYPYYYEIYSAVLGGLVGEYEIEIPDKENPKEKIWVKKYGLKGFSPIAKNFPYSDYDDFGVSRSYGYKRRHLGHDMMGQVGTPIIAVESGYVECLGWNQYGGWRIGIRSFDKKRYYYYAHLRKNYPYVKTLKEGDVVQAGDVIGYLGRTGYSSKENANNIDTSHLHFGMEIIFDESQKECNNEIWINCYNLIRFLYKNRSETAKNTETKEWYRLYNIKDPAAEAYLQEEQNTAD
ncbi:MAG: peptidoglycan DD-metalloendopeptidase family protein [Clostridia bacterium]|nr:peptidoglycan DD-metalloendopeptidase family protein [Clostridia bacterium]MCI1998832.1 peptidoglycan DD-metalloendopeptidase family protein [Clostridia bacterium]MCI2013582.1 peptidoglycan DD-metalloendopeptidase family protein [Clostridia bacterium]